MEVIIRVIEQRITENNIKQNDDIFPQKQLLWKLLQLIRAAMVQRAKIREVCNIDQIKFRLFSLRVSSLSEAAAATLFSTLHSDQ